MKKIYFLFTAMAVSASAFSQSAVQFGSQQTITSQKVVGEVNFPISSVVAADPTDTLGTDEWGTQLIQYGSDGGYIFGTSAVEFPVPPAPAPGFFQWNLEFARGFIANDAYTVIGAGFIFGSKEDVSGSPSDVTVKLYNVQASRAYSDITLQSPDALGPGTSVLASADLAFADADTVFPSFTWVDFDNAGWTPGDFAIGLDITSLYGAPSDTLVLLADADGDSDGEYTWTRITQGTSIGSQSLWAQTTGLFVSDLRNNLAIVAVVAESGVGIEEQGYLNGVKTTTFPNPALTTDNVTIQYGVETAVEEVNVSIYTLNGQVAYTIAEGAKASGIYNVNVPAGTLSAGSYIYAIEADGRRIAKKMEILK